MKNLKDQLNESLGINESTNIKDSDIDKVQKFWDKLWLADNIKSFIKKYESNSNEFDDIGSMMEMINSYVFSSKENGLLNELPDFFKNGGVEAWIKDHITTENIDLIDKAVDMYYKLYKEATHKDLQ